LAYEPHFIITFQTDETFETVITWFADHYDDFERQYQPIAWTSDNLIEIRHNDLYDPKIVAEKDDPLHYKFMLLVTCMIEGEIDKSVMEKQAQLANRFLQDLKARGYKVALDAPSVERFL